MKLNGRQAKKCPRCGNKCLLSQSRCEECGLIFSRLDYATNACTKKRIKAGEKEYVIYTNKYPADVKYWKLLLFSIFLGWFGVHHFYVGKYVRGILCIVGFILTLACTIFNAVLLKYIEMILFLPMALFALDWLFSITYIILHKYKVPVSLEVTSDGGVVV